MGLGWFETVFGALHLAAIVPILVAYEANTGAIAGTFPMLVIGGEFEVKVLTGG